MSGQRKALIIANDEYEQEALRDLLAPGADAEALGLVLGDAQIGAFAVQVVRNEPSSVIEEQIEDLFSESRPDDVLLLHFSGHGLKSEAGELFFAASNTRPNRLGSTAVAADFVQRCMRDARSRSVVLLLDCCYGGAFAQGVKVRSGGDVNVLDSFPQGKSGGGRGRAVITASNAMEYAFEGNRLADDQHRRPSVFTSALVEGLASGDADQDEDGLVSLNELYDYVFNKVREQNPHQTPSRQFELEGELYLARSRRRRIHPAPIPPDLQAAITDQNMYTRRGAVHELQSRLTSEDLPVAAGAYEALAELARTDIRYVAELASAALAQAVVRPDETELYFGEQPQGSKSRHRLVRLLGPPIARACAPHVSHDWIHVNETTEGLDVWVDTTGSGALRGSVNLKGPTGEAVIVVDVELLAQVAQTSRTERQSRPVDQGVMAPPISIDRPNGRLAVEGRQEAQQAAKPQAEQDGRDAAKAATPQAAKPRRAPAPTADESSGASPVTPAAPQATRPRTRVGAAYAGTVIALLSGIAGIISLVLLHTRYDSGVYYFFSLSIFVVVVVVAVIALTQIHRPVIIGFLQGMLWLAVPSLAAFIVILAHLSGYSTSYRAGNYIEFAAFAMGVIAAILLMVSWRPVADRRRAPQIRSLPMSLLGTAGLSQIASLILYVTIAQLYNDPPSSLSYYATFFYILGSAGVLTVLAVTWYAMSLRAPTLGAALVLGWVTVAALVMAPHLPGASGAHLFWAVLDFVLLAVVVVLTIIYVRRPPGPEGSAN